MLTFSLSPLLFRKELSVRLHFHRKYSDSSTFYLSCIKTNQKTRRKICPFLFGQIFYHYCRSNCLFQFNFHRKAHLGPSFSACHDCSLHFKLAFSQIWQTGTGRRISMKFFFHFWRKIFLSAALPPFAHAHCLQQLRGYTAGRTFLFTLIFLTVFPLFSQNSSELPFTGEEPPPAAPLSIIKETLPRIENPKFISPRTAKNEEERENISRGNEIWQQYQKDMERYRKIKNLPSNFPPEKIREKPVSLFYTYQVVSDKEKYLDTFHGLYARFQTSQGSLATINRISSPESIKSGMKLILPIPQGLFIPKKAESTLEILLQKEYAPLITEKTTVYDIDGQEFYFLPDRTFSPTQIAFFHDNGMQLPLSKKVITSEFGYRTSPVSGTWKFHAGIDLAAPIGTEVYACKSGIVLTTEQNHPLYGKYIDIKHNGNTVSRYAHLSKIFVSPGQSLTSGEVIGLVGTSGASTGPHLHFEVRENGTPTDPARQIKKLNKF